jgi:hypothetical protein
MAAGFSILKLVQGGIVDLKVDSFNGKFRQPQSYIKSGILSTNSQTRLSLNSLTTHNHVDI